MSDYSKKLEAHIREQARQALLQKAAAPVAARLTWHDGTEVWAVRPRHLQGRDVADPHRAYWPIGQQIRIEGVRHDQAMTVVFGLDCGPLGLGRLYAVDRSQETQSLHAETMAELAPNPYGLVQIPAALTQDGQGCFYIVMAYLAVRGMSGAMDAPTGALWRVELGHDAAPVLLHTFLPGQGQPACLRPGQPVRAAGAETAWVREALDGKLQGSLRIGALRFWPPSADPTGQTVLYEINKDGSGFRCLPAISPVQEGMATPTQISRVPLEAEA